MNTIEHKLWDYIDGNLDEAQREDIREKIEKDISVRIQYEALLNLNLAFSGMELEEPSMSFTRNVMEDVSLQPAPVAMKTKVDKRIIFSIGGFFILSILAILGYVLYTSTFTMPDLNFNLNLDLSVQKFITPTALYMFLFVDLVIGLVFIDHVLRKNLDRRD